jgi:hypothetical protein
MTPVEELLTTIIMKLDKIIENQEKTATPLNITNSKLLLEQLDTPFSKTEAIGKEYVLPTPWNNQPVCATTEDILPEYRPYNTFDRREYDNL